MFLKWDAEVSMQECRVPAARYSVFLRVAEVFLKWDAEESM